METNSDERSEKLGDAQLREHAGRFIAYLNYLRAIRAYLRRHYEDPSQLFLPIVTSDSYQGIQGGVRATSGEVQGFLLNAWSTEVQLHLIEPTNELLPYSNHWAPVAAYYSTYLAIRALLAAANRPVRSDHAATLACISNDIHSRSGLFPPPWCFLCTGDPEFHTEGYEHLPPGTVVGRASALSSGDYVPFADSFCMFLRTTRKRQIDNRLRAWRKTSKKKRVSAEMRATLVENIPPTSVFDALYRLRIRSNYDDVAESFLSLPGLDDGVAFNLGLRELTWYSLAVLECLISRYFGSQQFDALVQRFSGRAGILGQDLVARRWAALRPIVNA